MTRAMVVIPTYREIENIGVIVRAILQHPEGFHILIVDDNSPDGTGEAADALAREFDRVHVLHRKAKEGIGPAYIAGFRYALAWGAEAIVQMDADLSHDPAALPGLMAGLQDADLVLGSRYHNGVRVLDWSARRLALSLAASLYVRALLRMPVDDPTGGFKVWRRRTLESLDLDRVTSRGYSFQVEMTYRVWRAGFRLLELPIVFQERKRGGSKISRGIVYEALYVLWRIRLKSHRDVRSEPSALDAPVLKRVP